MPKYIGLPTPHSTASCKPCSVRDDQHLKVAVPNQQFCIAKHQHKSCRNNLKNVSEHYVLDCSDAVVKLLPLQKTQEHYKTHYDRRVCEPFTFRSGKRPFIDEPPLSDTKSGISDNIATAASNKLYPQSLSPFCIVTVHSHSLVIDEHDKHNSVSIDRVTPAPHIANLNTDKTSCNHVSKTLTKIKVAATAT